MNKEETSLRLQIATLLKINPKKVKAYRNGDYGVLEWFLSIMLEVNKEMDIEQVSDWLVNQLEQ